MKQVGLSLLTILLLVIYSCNETDSIKIPQYSKYASIIIDSEEYFTNGTLMRCQLKDTVRFGQFLCTGWAHFSKKGSLIQADLAQKTTYKEITLPKGTTIFLNDSAIITHFWPSTNLVIQGIECKGGNKIDISLYNTGKLNCCFLNRDQMIQGFPCSSSLFKPVCFYQNGNLQGCILSKDFVIKEHGYKKGTRLILDENGGVIFEKDDK